MRTMVAASFAIRQFREEDLPSVFELVYNTIDIAYNEVYPPEAIDYFKEYHSERIILEDAAAGYTLVAECGGQIVGTGTLLGVNVRRVFISPQHQHRGIGRSIAQRLEAEARRGRSTTIDLAASLVSLQFWESLGFTAVGEYFVPVKYGKKLRYYQMEKYLETADNL